MPRQLFSDRCSKEELQLMWNTMTQQQISDKLGFTTKCIYKHIKKWDLQKRVNGRSCPWTLLDEDSELINYLGGFGYADGCFQKTSITGYHFTISISKKDIEIRDLLHKNIKGSKVGEYIDAAGKSMVSLYLYGVDLPEKLLKFGITQDKRYHWTEPIISNEMLPHFLRGWFDGDGYIGKDKYLMVLTNINKEAIEWFDSKIKFLGYNPKRGYRWSSKEGRIVIPTNIHSQSYSSKKRKTVYRHIITGKENCLSIYNLLKGDSILRLDRKWSLLEK